MKRKDLWVETFSGRKVDLINPDPEAICIEDIAHHLAMINRYNGATVRPYSVAEHCLILADYLSPSTTTALEGLNVLLHDAAEAYLQDLSPDLKRALPLYKSIEDNMLYYIHGALRVPFLKDRGFVKWLDSAVLLDERRALMPHHPPSVKWGVDEGVLKPLDVQISLQDVPWRDVEKAFLSLFRELKQRIPSSEKCVPHMGEHCIQYNRTGVQCRRCGAIWRGVGV
jgi:hypothetical protein